MRVRGRPHGHPDGRRRRRRRLGRSGHRPPPRPHASRRAGYSLVRCADRHSRASATGRREAAVSTTGEDTGAGTAGRNHETGRTGPDDSLYVLTAVLLTPAQFPSVLGDDYPQACRALGLEPYAEGYGLVLRAGRCGGPLDGRGERRVAGRRGDRRVGLRDGVRPVTPRGQRGLRASRVAARPVGGGARPARAARPPVGARGSRSLGAGRHRGVGFGPAAVGRRRDRPAVGLLAAAAGRRRLLRLRRGTGAGRRRGTGVPPCAVGCAGLWRIWSGTWRIRLHRGGYGRCSHREGARLLRADGPGWSLVARTDDIAFVLLDERPQEVLPVGRGSRLPVLLAGLDAMAVRPG